MEKSYVASLPINVVSPNVCQDFWVFPGNASNIVRIWKISWGFYGASGGGGGYQLFRRNTANIGGTIGLLDLGKSHPIMPIPVSPPFYYTVNASSLGSFAPNGTIATYLFQ